jgi:hypothetical protein
MTMIKKSFSFGFTHLGDYPLTLQSITADGQAHGTTTPFPCAIRNKDELLRERVEMGLMEILSAKNSNGPLPLIRSNQDGVWTWMSKQQLWWPLNERQKVNLGLDRGGNVRLCWPAL